MSYNISKSPEDVLIINLLLYSINVSKFSKNFTICNEAVGVLITELRKMQKMNQKLSSLENELRVEKNDLEHNGSISNTNPVKNKPCDTMWSILQMLWKMDILVPLCLFQMCLQHHNGSLNMIKKVKTTFILFKMNNMNIPNLLAL